MNGPDCRCLWCGRSLKYEDSLSGMFWVSDVICRKCRQAMKMRKRVFCRKGIRITSFYQYADTVRDMIIQYKELNDEALFPLFLWPVAARLKRKYRDHVIVPVPSHVSRHEKRGFRAVEKMYSLLELPVYDVLIKDKAVSQKSRGHKKRQEIGRYLRIRDDHGLENRKVLLVDDICTSGETIAACHKLLSGNCRKITVLALANVFTFRPLFSVYKKIKRNYN